MAKEVWSNQEVTDNLLRAGLSWSTPTVTFGFPTSAPSWSMGNEGNGFSAFSESQKDVARLALGLWDDLVATDFVESASDSDITFQNTTTDIGYAHAYYPGGWSAAGSVWLNPQYNSGTNNLVTPTPGIWGFMAYIHEIGHAIGLDHPGEYNGGSPTYENDAEYAQDSTMYTVMSYFDAAETGADHIAGNGKWYAPQTPMIHDILAIQALYGVETTTRTGDTTYGFNSTADRSVYDFTENLHPIVAIWDSGGIDTLDLSGFGTDSRINLNPGTFSDADNMTMNLSIAFGCWIENAVGGAGDDLITGNELANTLRGNAGHDELLGGEGNDRLVGGSGADTMDGGGGIDTVDFRNEAGASLNLISGTAGGSATSDVFISIERFLGSITAGDDIAAGGGQQQIFGYGGNDELYGGASNDKVKGGRGADLIEGGAGNDIVSGGAGGDAFMFSGINWGHDTITDFKDGIDWLSFDAMDGNNFDDLVIAGNGTSVVIVTLGDSQIKITGVGGNAVTLTEADFLFL